MIFQLTDAPGLGWWVVACDGACGMVLTFEARDRFTTGMAFAAGNKSFCSSCFERLRAS